MASVSSVVDKRHKSLMIRLCKMMDPSDAAYRDFILFLRSYIPRGVLSRVQHNPTDVIALLEERGILNVGKYEALEKALKASGYVTVLDLLKNDGKRTSKLLRAHAYSGGPMADGSSDIGQHPRKIRKLGKEIPKIKASTSSAADLKSEVNMESGQHPRKIRKRGKEILKIKANTSSAADLESEVNMESGQHPRKISKRVKEILKIKASTSSAADLESEVNMESGGLKVSDSPKLGYLEDIRHSLSDWRWSLPGQHPRKISKRVKEILKIKASTSSAADLESEVNMESGGLKVSDSPKLGYLEDIRHSLSDWRWSLPGQHPRKIRKRGKEIPKIKANTSSAADLESEVNMESERLGNVSTVSVMEEKNREALMIHNVLVGKLNGLITEDSLQIIKRMARIYLSLKNLEKVTCMDKLLTTLEENGQIGVGEYDNLIRIMIAAGVGIGLEEILQTAKDIKDILQNQIPSEEQSEEEWPYHLLSLEVEDIMHKTLRPKGKTKKRDGNEFVYMEVGRATGKNVTLEDIRKAWKSIETELLDDLYPKSILCFFVQKGILSDSEYQAINQKTRRQMAEYILQRVEAKLPDAFYILLRALRETDQDKAVDVMTKIINGTFVSKTTAPVLNLPSFQVKMKVRREGSTIDSTEMTISSIFKKDSEMFSFNLCSDIFDVTKGSVIIHLRPRRKHARETLEFFCRHGGMKAFMLNLLKKRDVFVSLPVGKISIDVEVCCEKEEDSVSESTHQPVRYFGCENIEVLENPQVIKENLLLQAGTLLEEIDPLPLLKTFIERDILDESFFNILKQLRRRDRALLFLDKVCGIGSEAMLALVDALKASDNEALATQLCSVKIKNPNLKDTGTATGKNFTLEDIRKAWKSIETELLDDLYPKSILPFFVKGDFFSDDEYQAIFKKTRREMTKEILQRVEEKLPDAFSLLIKALKETDQDKVVDVVTRIINGSHVSKTTGQEDDSLVDVVVKDVNTNAEDGMLQSYHLEVSIRGNDDDQVDDSLVEVVTEEMTTSDEDGMLWSCHLEVRIHRNDDDDVRNKPEVSKKGKHLAQESYGSNEPNKRVVKYPHKRACIGLKSGDGTHLCLDVQENRIVSEEQLSIMSSHIGKEWEFLGRVLGITDAKLEQIKEDSQNTRECIYQMLKSWKGLSGEKATISVLRAAIQKSGIVVDNDSIKNILDGTVCVSIGSK